MVFFPLKNFLLLEGDEVVGTPESSLLGINLSGGRR